MWLIEGFLDAKNKKWMFCLETLRRRVIGGVHYYDTTVDD